MSSSLLERASVSDEATVFLMRHHAHGEMDAIYQLIEQCFPVARHLDVRLQEDPDEEGREKIVLFPIMPAATPIEELSVGIRQFHEIFCQIMSPARQSLFSMVPDFAAE